MKKRKQNPNNEIIINKKIKGFQTKFILNNDVLLKIFEYLSGNYLIIKKKKIYFLYKILAFEILLFIPLVCKNWNKIFILNNIILWKNLLLKENYAFLNINNNNNNNISNNNNNENIKNYYNNNNENIWKNIFLILYKNKIFKKLYLNYLNNYSDTLLQNINGNDKNDENFIKFMDNTNKIQNNFIKNIKNNSFKRKHTLYNISYKNFSNDIEMEYELMRKLIYSKPVFNYYEKKYESKEGELDNSDLYEISYESEYINDIYLFGLNGNHIIINFKVNRNTSGLYSSVKMMSGDMIFSKNNKTLFDEILKLKLDYKFIDYNAIKIYLDLIIKNDYDFALFHNENAFNFDNDLNILSIDL
jgi:hypothetical protein